MRYLEFRPYINDIDIPAKQPKDSGYYFKINSSDPRLIKNTLEDNGFLVTNRDDWTIYWSSAPIKQNQYLEIREYQKVNHFPRSGELTRKDLLYKNIARMQTLYNKSYSFIPRSYLLPNEYSFLQDDMEKENMIFIVKPVASSQGRGIFVTNNLQDVIYLL